MVAATWLERADGDAPAKGDTSDRAGGTSTHPDMNVDFPLDKQSPDTDDLVQAMRKLKEVQDNSLAGIAALHARLVACEQQLVSASKQADLAAASSRVPMLIAEQPRMPQLVAQPMVADTSSEAAPATPMAGASQDGTLIGRQEVAAFFKRLSDLEETQADEFDALHDANNATRTGMERLARDLQIERAERREMQAHMQHLAGLGPSFERFQKDLKSELAELIRESAANVKVDVSSRSQLVMVELRGELQRASVASSPTDSTTEPATTVSLREWLPQDSDGNVAATTSMLKHLGVFDNMDLLAPGGGLPEQLVARPNTRFVHRAVISIKHSTGYPQGVLENWPEPHEAKLDFINKVWSSIVVTLNLHDTDFDAEGVLKCTDRKGTRRLLQLLAIAASMERGQQRQPGLT